MIVVERPGLLTTVQDLGRVGWAHLGVPRAGAADPVSLRRANALVGNPPGTAGLETTLVGPVLVFAATTTIALTGARTAPTLDDRPIPTEVPLTVPAGRRLVVGPASAGLRTYLAVRGGIAVPMVLGSRSTDTLSGLGPAPVRAGDRLPVGEQPIARSGAPADIPPPVALVPEPVLRVLPGPQADAFPPDVLAGPSYTVTPASDRTGLRLSGPPLPAGADIASTGMVAGGIQLPPDGQPILLLANHPPTGGYPVVAVVVSADLPRAAQLRPGARLRFAYQVASR